MAPSAAEREWLPRNTPGQPYREWDFGISVVGRTFPIYAFNTKTQDVHLRSQPHWVEEALKELGQVNGEARDEGCPVPNRTVKANARHIIGDIDFLNLPVPSVSPTDDGGIAIFFSSPTPGAGVLILCEAEGSGACFSSFGGKNDRARYTDAGDMPGAFVLEKLQQILSWS